MSLPSDPYSPHTPTDEIVLVATGEFRTIEDVKGPGATMKSMGAAGIYSSGLPATEPIRAFQTATYEAHTEGTVVPEVRKAESLPSPASGTEKHPPTPSHQSGPGTAPAHVHLPAHAPRPHAAPATPGAKRIGRDSTPESVGSTLRSFGLEELPDCTTDYKVRAMIGRGSQGEVFEAMQVRLGRLVAIKRADDSLEARKDFFKEAFALAQLDHPNIVPIYDIGTIGKPPRQHPILTMKRVRGTPWHRLMRNKRNGARVPPSGYLQRHLGILVQVLNALSYAHARQIIHRDLKPSQVILGDFGEVMLLDWGLAVYLGDPASPPSDTEPAVAATHRRLFTLDTAINPSGTPSYMAPEQTTEDQSKLGFCTDIYLVGAMLFEILTGDPPHPGHTVDDALRAANRNEILPMPEGLPPELAELALHCMRTEPADRPDSVVAVRSRLEAYLTGATRREESRRLVTLITQGPEPADYDSVSACSRRLIEAQQLWANNPDLGQCRDVVLRHFVKVALASGDFTLAQLQADRLSDAREAEDWGRRIDEAREAALDRLPRPPLLTARRLTVWLAAMALCLAVVLAGYHAAYTAVQQEVLNQVASLAAVAAADLRVEDLRAVETSQKLQSPEFQRVMNRLNFYRRSNRDVRFIGVVAPVTQQGKPCWRTIVDADPTDFDLNANNSLDPWELGRPPGHVDCHDIPAMHGALATREPTSALTRRPWGGYVSGFAPVLAPGERQPMGLLSIHVEDRALEAKLAVARHAAMAGGGVLVALVSLAFFAFYSSRKAMARSRQLEDLIRRQSEALRGRTLNLG